MSVIRKIARPLSKKGRVKTPTTKSVLRKSNKVQANVKKKTAGGKKLTSAKRSAKQNDRRAMRYNRKQQTKEAATPRVSQNSKANRKAAASMQRASDRAGKKESYSSATEKSVARKQDKKKYLGMASDKQSRMKKARTKRRTQRRKTIYERIRHPDRDPF